MDTKEKHEEKLLSCIDIPYFRNNPAYIDLWRSYYKQFRDPQVLFLMYHKQISTYFHWIHIELSQYFLRKKQPQIAYFVLEEAIKNKVFDQERIKEALTQIPHFEKKYSKGDMLAVLNLKNIKCFGRIWNTYNEEIFYHKNLPYQYPTFEAMKIAEYENKFNTGLVFDNTISEIKQKEISIDEHLYNFSVDNEVFKAPTTEESQKNIEAFGILNSFNNQIDDNLIKEINEPSFDNSINKGNNSFSQSQNQENRIYSHDTKEAESIELPKCLSNATDLENKFDKKLEIEKSDCNHVFSKNDNSSELILESKLNFQKNEELHSCKNSMIGSCVETTNNLNVADSYSILPNNTAETLISQQSNDKIIVSEPSTATKSNFQTTLDDFLDQNSTQEILSSTLELQNEDFSKKIKITQIEDDCIPQFFEINGSLDLNSELTINGYVYFVQSVENNGFSLLKVAKTDDVTLTIIGKTYMLIKSDLKSLKTAKELFNFDICHQNNSYFILYDFVAICTLKSMIGKCNENVKAFYLKKIVEKLVLLDKTFLTISDPLDFFVDQDFNLGFGSFNLKPSSRNETVECLKQAFSIFDISISENFVCSLQTILSTVEARRDIIKHKTEVLESL